MKLYKTASEKTDSALSGLDLSTSNRLDLIRDAKVTITREIVYRREQSACVKPIYACKGHEHRVKVITDRLKEVDSAISRITAKKAISPSSSSSSHPVVQFPSYPDAFTLLITKLQFFSCNSSSHRTTFALLIVKLWFSSCSSSSYSPDAFTLLITKLQFFSCNSSSHRTTFALLIVKLWFSSCSSSSYSPDAFTLLITKLQFFSCNSSSHCTTFALLIVKLWFSSCSSIYVEHVKIDG